MCRSGSAGDDPLVVLIAHNGADETDHCLVVGEDADDAPGGVLNSPGACPPASTPMRGVAQIPGLGTAVHLCCHLPERQSGGLVAPCRRSGYAVPALTG
jgi:hypothetical protein